MTNAALDALQLVLASQVDDLTPVLEGYRDLERAMAKPEEESTAEAVRQHILVLQRRLDLVEAGRTALTLLVEDGFDAIPNLQLEPTEFAIFTANNDTIDAAKARTTALPEPAGGARFRLSPGVPKSS